MAYNLVGKTFTDLIVISKYPQRNAVGKTLWKCICKCGNEVLVVTNRLTCKHKAITTCGRCEWHVKHKDAYISWMAARSRCYNENDKDYSRYGGRGIKMCARWARFSAFFEDMGDPPRDIITGERLTLERKNTNGDYEPDNCKWADRYEQQSNRRYCK
jgi:hypothetical protein